MSLNHLSNDNRVFDIRLHIEKLTPTNRKNRYQCPVCGGGILRLSLILVNINAGMGVSAGILENPSGLGVKLSVVAMPAAGVAIAPTILSPPENQNQSPHLPQFRIPARLQHCQRNWRFGDIPLEYIYTPSTKTVRVNNPDGTKERSIPIPHSLWMGKRGVGTETYPYVGSTESWGGGTETHPGMLLTMSYFWAKGEGGEKFIPYKLNDAKQYGAGKWVLILEGEKCVEYARKYFGLVGLTFSGGNWRKESLIRNFNLIKDTNIAGVVD